MSLLGQWRQCDCRALYEQGRQSDARKLCNNAVCTLLEPALFNLAIHSPANVEHERASNHPREGGIKV